MDEKAIALFAETAVEYLDELEEALLILSDNLDDKKEVDRIFRVMHTIKGSAAMLDYTEISSFAHVLESEFDYIRRGEVRLTGKVVELTLKARDLLHRLVEGESGLKEQTDEVIQNIQQQRVDLNQGKEEGLTLAKIGLAQIYSFKENVSQLSESSDLQIYVVHISQLFTWLYYLSLKAQLEDVTEFLSEFESYYRKLQFELSAITPKAISVAKQAIEEVETMLKASEEDPEAQDMDPEKVMQALQRPLEIQASLSELKSSTTINESSSSYQNDFLIEIEVSDDVLSYPFDTKEDIIKAFERLGEVKLLSVD